MHVPYLTRAILVAVVASAPGLVPLRAAAAQDDASPATEPAMPADLPHVADARNRLGAETSPYLLQHRNNPVHWWPWGAEAFAAARALDRPIFLSIGYSTCYWCHVMERESFENDDVAALLNEHFIAIKVDREERPDVDDIYMAATQLLNQGQGGWPMSVFLEPHGLKPFLAGTYYPPEDRFGRPGFRSVLTQVAGFWDERRDDLLMQADRIGAIVAERLAEASRPVPIGADQVRIGVAQLMGVYDADDGGFGRGQNKFPTPVNLDFLVGVAWDQPAVRAAVVHTLDRMAIGGMYDQVGGGFHRYSTDPQWLVPHFEKMLYDNGQLASTYAEAFARTGDAFYAEIVRETLDYVLREMTEPTGAFRSAQDAEVNHLEGGNYLWTKAEMAAALADAGLGDEVDFALTVYGLNAGTNFTDPHHPEAGAKNVLFLAERPEAVAANLGLEPDAVAARLGRVNAALLQARDRRDQPLTDDKILAGWNGLMIAGFADGGRGLEEPRYVEAAARAAAFVLADMRNADGGLLRAHRLGESRIDAFLEDYAFLVRGLLALHRATGDAAHLAQAVELTDAARSRFFDTTGGGWFDTLADRSDLFVRVKSTYDGATPSGNGQMLLNVIELHGRTGDDRFLEDAALALGASSSDLRDHPTALVLTALGLHRLAAVAPDVVAGIGVAGDGPARGPVRVTASVPEVILAEGEQIVFEVTIAIDAGYHVTAREPGLPDLIPLAIGSAADGVEIEVTYPPGMPFRGPLGTMRVHEGTVHVPVRVRRTGTIAGTPLLTVTWQACTSEACLLPETTVVPVRIGGR